MCYNGKNEEQNEIKLFVLEFLGVALTAHSEYKVKSRVQKIFSNIVALCYNLKIKNDDVRYLKMNNKIREIRLCDAVDNSVAEINVALFLMKSISARPGELSENDALAANYIVIDILEKCSACLSAARSGSDEDGDTE